MPQSATTHIHSGRRLPRIGVLVGYGLLFVLFDMQATLFEAAPGVSPWYPSAGLNLALVLIFGLRYLPAVLVATLFSGLFISNPPIAWYHLIGPNLAVVLGHGAAAAWLRSRFADRNPMNLRSAYELAAVALVLPVFVGTASVLSYTLTGMEGYAWSTFGETTLAWWRGDAVGLLSLTPLLFWAAAPYTSEWQAVFEGEERLGTHLARPRLLAEAAAQLAAVALALYLAFYTPSGSFHYYFCFLPLLWTALRYGLPRATLAVFLTNLGAVLILASLGAEDAIFGFQLFMIALALTGLLLGGLVSERRRAVRSLRRAHGLLVERLRQHPVATLDGPDTPSLASITSEDTLQRYIGQLQQEQTHLADAGQHLREQSARKDELFSLISHDLKNLIFSSVSLAEALDEDADTLPRPEIRDLAGYLADASQRTYDLLESFLQWVRVQAGQISCHPVSLSAQQVVQDGLLLVEENARRKNIALHSDVPGRLRIQADPHMSAAVLRNLLVNAVKYTDTGGRVTVAAHREENEKNMVEFAVSDTGVGIAEERLDRLFRIGQIRSTPGTDEETGTGLGLLLCKQMVEQHGGRLWAESPSGEGSTFFFTLPCTDDPPVPPASSNGGPAAPAAWPQNERAETA